MRSLPYSFFFLWLFLFLWTHIADVPSERLRAFSVATAAPAWRMGSSLRTYLADRPFLGASKRVEQGEQLAHLQLQNHLLQSQLEEAKEWVVQEKGALRSKQLEHRLQRQGSFLQAKVIYRVPSSWSHSVWIDVGEEENQTYGYPVISRNSPVADGNRLIGVVDYLGKRQSRVRLITDPGLNPAVRVDRGSLSQKEIHCALAALADRLEGREDCLEQLSLLKEKIKIQPQELYLAKGELRGALSPFWRLRPLLRGVGFNYNSSDQEGSARDLRSSPPIIQKGDHLITSGLDGIFPFGLSVAVVEKVAPLTDGSFSYEIEATPTAPSLNDLRQLFVLPVSGD